jgi:hypothetical protein
MVYVKQAISPPPFDVGCRSVIASHAFSFNERFGFYSVNFESTSDGPD